MNQNLTRALSVIKNCLSIGRFVVVFKVSKVLVQLVEVLYREGYVESYSITSRGRSLKVSFKTYCGKPVLRSIQMVSRGGSRVYSKKSSLGYRASGDSMGVFILVTDHGILSGPEALRLGVGGEVICLVSLILSGALTEWFKVGVC